MGVREMICRKEGHTAFSDIVVGKGKFVVVCQNCGHAVAYKDTSINKQGR